MKLESRVQPSRGDAGSPRTEGTSGGETKGKVDRNSRRSSWGWGAGVAGKPSPHSARNLGAGRFPRRSLSYPQRPAT